jgi:hypothetical protein
MASFKRRFEAKWMRGIPIRLRRDPCERGGAVNPVSDFEEILEDIATAAERRDEETIPLKDLQNRLKVEGPLSD